MAQLVTSHPHQMMILPATNPNAKDSRWLTLEVCREFQRSKCSRSDNECKFAHPGPHVEVQNGRVVACFDSIKGKCQRKDPPCKYLHPPQHLREQLLQNGRNNLILKNLQLQAYQQYAGVMPVTHYPGLQALSTVPPQASPASYSPYITATSLASVALPSSAETSTGMSQALGHSMIPTAKAVRADKFETTTDSGEAVTTHPSLVDTLSYPTYITQPTSAAALPPQVVLAKKRARDPADDIILSTMPGMLPAYKRVAVGDLSKGGIPVYQASPLVSPLQHTSLMQLQQPYIPVSFAGHPPSVPRF